MSATPMLPTVHLNGTSLDMLSEGWERIGEAIEELGRAVETLEFNPRDYYPQGSDAWERAAKRMAEHTAALRRFKMETEDVQRELFRVRLQRQDRQS